MYVEKALVFLIGNQQSKHDETGGKFWQRSLDSLNPQLEGDVLSGDITKINVC